MRPEPRNDPDDVYECVGVRVPCWDAKRRVWQALDLLRREQLRKQPQGSRDKEWRGRKASAGS